MWFGIGAVLGWPFAGVLVSPFVLEEIVVALVTGDSWETFRRILDGTVRSLILVVSMIVPGCSHVLTRAGFGISCERVFLPYANHRSLGDRVLQRLQWVRARS